MNPLKRVKREAEAFSNTPPGYEAMRRQNIYNIRLYGLKYRNALKGY